MGLLLGFFLTFFASNESALWCENPTQELACPIIARVGCCVFSGGVCGCQGGCSVCCDGTLTVDPSCRC